MISPDIRRKGFKNAVMAAFRQPGRSDQALGVGGNSKLYDRFRTARALAIAFWIVTDLRPYVDAVLFDFSGSGSGDRVPFVCAESPLLAGEVGFDLLASVVRPAAQVHVAAFFAAVWRALGRILVMLGEPPGQERRQ